MNSKFYRFFCLFSAISLAVQFYFPNKCPAQSLGSVQTLAKPLFRAVRRNALQAGSPELNLDCARRIVFGALVFTSFGFDGNTDPDVTREGIFVRRYKDIPAGMSFRTDLTFHLGLRENRGFLKVIPSFSDVSKTQHLPFKEIQYKELDGSATLTLDYALQNTILAMREFIYEGFIQDESIETALLRFLLSLKILISIPDTVLRDALNSKDIQEFNPYASLVTFIEYLDLITEWFAKNEFGTIFENESIPESIFPINLINRLRSDGQHSREILAIFPEDSAGVMRKVTKEIIDRLNLMLGKVYDGQYQERKEEMVYAISRLLKITYRLGRISQDDFNYYIHNCGFYFLRALKSDGISRPYRPVDGRYFSHF